MTLDALKSELLIHRRQSYARLRGGFPIPLAGATYWAILTILSNQLDYASWANIAVWASGAIFPLALLFAKLFDCPFMKDKTAIGDALLPTFISMLLFWPMLFVAVGAAPETFPVMLAIGMSLHWPVIGWSYGRTLPFTLHTVARAIGTVYIYYAFPQAAPLLISIFVMAAYLITAGFIYWDSGRYSVTKLARAQLA